MIRLIKKKAKSIVCSVLACGDIVYNESGCICNRDSYAD